MAATGAGSSSLSVPELQRQLAELAEELRVRKEAESFALQREEAFADILSVINDPNADISRVFSVMIERATKLCSAAYGYVWLYMGSAPVLRPRSLSSPLEIGCVIGSPFQTRRRR